ncbi:MAG: glucose-1-phosphate adenylyltransferase subunit GlgD [Clostridiales bacterium]|nr:glucose-1-phosphate adenylyltransferase subunit GlgD [Clostridiales bacterium]
MRVNNIVGIIYSNAYDSALSELTALRTMGSVPFGGRYRLIDFALSEMVNSGITKVGVITKNNYRSLMDHLGTGKSWDLSRKKDGMFILPPFSNADSHKAYNNRIEALTGTLDFIRNSKEDYVVMCDCNVLCNIDLGKFFHAHIESGADITIAYHHGKTPATDPVTFELDGSGRIISAPLANISSEESDYSLNIYVLRRSLLERLINEANSMGCTSFLRDVIGRNLEKLKIYGYEVADFVRVIDSLQSYFNISLELLDKDNRKALFHPERPVYTKVRDNESAFYALGSNVGNSLVADGCKIYGTVENCILFRDVVVSKNAVVRNSIIMQDSYIGEGARAENVIFDKGVTLKPGKVLCGALDYPVYVGKNITV